MTNSTFSREIEKDVGHLGTYVVNNQSVPHRTFYNTQYINLPTKLETSLESGSRSGVERINQTDLISQSDYNQTELVNSEGSSSESLASSRDTSQNVWVHERNLHKILSDDQIILPKKGVKQDKEDIFKKLSSRDYL